MHRSIVLISPSPKSFRLDLALQVIIPLEARMLLVLRLHHVRFRERICSSPFRELLQTIQTSILPLLTTMDRLRFLTEEIVRLPRGLRRHCLTQHLLDQSYMNILIPMMTELSIVLTLPLVKLLCSASARLVIMISGEPMVLR